MNFLRRLIYAEGVTPLPSKLVASIYFLMLFNAMVTTSVFPYLPKLVKSIGISEVDAGSKVGLIASSLFVGRMLFSFFWGYLGDTKGRKLVLITTASCLTSATIAFGFTFNLPWAMVTRFLQGCSMGIIVLSKSIVSSHCDETNASLGMSIIIGATSTGMIIGPSIGGFLAFPESLYPGTFPSDSIFSRFGILLPSTILVAGLVTCITLCLIFIPRDIKKTEYEEETECLIPVDNNIRKYTDNSLSFSENSIGRRSTLRRSTSRRKTLRSLSNTIDCEYDEYVTVAITASPERNQLVDIYEIVEPFENEKEEDENEKKCCQLSTFKDSKLMQLLRTKNCVLASLLYGLYSFIGIGIDELFPLYASTSKKYHGFGFDTSSISITLMSAALANLILQFVLLPRLVRYFGPRKVYIGAVILQSLFFPLLPLIEMIGNRYLFWAAMLTTMFFIQFGRSSAFLSVNILLNNSVEAELLGSANGFGITCGTLGRVISPSVLGTTFAWSLKNIKGESPNALGFPFNYFFPFFILSFLAICTSFLVIFLFPKSMDKKKTRMEEVDNEMNNDSKDKKYLTVGMEKPTVPICVDGN